MSTDISYIKRLNTAGIVGLCKQYGASGFIGDGITEVEKIEKLGQAVIDLEKKNTNLETFFLSSLNDDSSFIHIEYLVRDFNPELAYVRIVKITYWKNHTSTCSQEELGPILLRIIAQTLVDVLNTQFLIIIDNKPIKIGDQIVESSTGNWTVTDLDLKNKRIRASSEKYGNMTFESFHIIWNDSSNSWQVKLP